MTGSHPALTAGSFRSWDWPLSCPLCSPDLPGPDSGRKRGVLFLEWRMWEASQLEEGEGATS